MAENFENTVLALTFMADEDLTSDQHKFVKQTSRTGYIERCDVDGEKAIGVLKNKPDNEQAATVMVQGVTKVVVKTSETIAVRDLVGTSSDGTATKRGLHPRRMPGRRDRPRHRHHPAAPPGPRDLVTVGSVNSEA
jgi:hypothetical protein